MVDLFDQSPGRRPAKSAAAFRTISEVADELAVPQHVLRFWESKFSQIRPLKRGGGRRYYRPEDVMLLRRIRQCLYDEGYTIKGVQRLLREGSLRPEDLASEPAATPPSRASSGGAPSIAKPPASAASRPSLPNGRDPLHAALRDIRRELRDLRDLLKRGKP
jgi:DNA-binding transcriptional MerR regulator